MSSSNLPVQCHEDPIRTLGPVDGGVPDSFWSDDDDLQKPAAAKSPHTSANPAQPKLRRKVSNMSTASSSPLLLRKSKGTAVSRRKDTPPPIPPPPAAGVTGQHPPSPLSSPQSSALPNSLFTSAFSSQEQSSRTSAGGVVKSECSASKGGVDRIEPLAQPRQRAMLSEKSGRAVQTAAAEASTDGDPQHNHHHHQQRNINSSNCGPRPYLVYTEPPLPQSKVIAMDAFPGLLVVITTEKLYIYDTGLTSTSLEFKAVVERSQAEFLPPNQKDYCQWLQSQAEAANIPLTEAMLLSTSRWTHRHLSFPPMFAALEPNSGFVRVPVVPRYVAVAGGGVSGRLVSVLSTKPGYSFLVVNSLHEKGLIGSQGNKPQGSAVSLEASSSSSAEPSLAVMQASSSSSLSSSPLSCQLPSRIAGIAWATPPVERQQPGTPSVLFSVDVDGNIAALCFQRDQSVVIYCNDEVVSETTNEIRDAQYEESGSSETEKEVQLVQSQRHGNDAELSSKQKKRVSQFLAAVKLDSTKDVGDVSLSAAMVNNDPVTGKPPKFRFQLLVLRRGRVRVHLVPTRKDGALLNAAATVTVMVAAEPGMCLLPSIIGGPDAQAPVAGVVLRKPLKHRTTADATPTTTAVTNAGTATPESALTSAADGQGSIPGKQAVESSSQDRSSHHPLLHSSDGQPPPHSAIDVGAAWYISLPDSAAPHIVRQIAVPRLEAAAAFHNTGTTSVQSSSQPRATSLQSHPTLCCSTTPIPWVALAYSGRGDNLSLIMPPAVATPLSFGGNTPLQIPADIHLLSLPPNAGAAGTRHATMPVPLFSSPELVLFQTPRVGCAPYIDGNTGEVKFGPVLFLLGAMRATPPSPDLLKHSPSHENGSSVDSQSEETTSHFSNAHRQSSPTTAAVVPCGASLLMVPLEIDQTPTLDPLFVAAKKLLVTADQSYATITQFRSTNTPPLEASSSSSSFSSFKMPPSERSGSVPSTHHHSNSMAGSTNSGFWTTYKNTATPGSITSLFTSTFHGTSIPNVAISEFVQSAKEKAVRGQGIVASWSDRTLFGAAAPTETNMAKGYRGRTVEEAMADAVGDVPAQMDPADLKRLQKQQRKEEKMRLAKEARERAVKNEQQSESSSPKVSGTEQPSASSLGTFSIFRPSSLLKTVLSIATGSPLGAQGPSETAAKSTPVEKKTGTPAGMHTSPSGSSFRSQQSAERFSEENSSDDDDEAGDSFAGVPQVDSDEEMKSVGSPSRGGRKPMKKPRKVTRATVIFDATKGGSAVMYSSKGTNSNLSAGKDNSNQPSTTDEKTELPVPTSTKADEIEDAAAFEALALEEAHQAAIQQLTSAESKARGRLELTEMRQRSEHISAPALRLRDEWYAQLRLQRQRQLKTEAIHKWAGEASAARSLAQLRIGEAASGFAAAVAAFQKQEQEAISEYERKKAEEKPDAHIPGDEQPKRLLHPFGIEMVSQILDRDRKRLIAAVIKIRQLYLERQLIAKCRIPVIILERQIRKNRQAPWVPSQMHFVALKVKKSTPVPANTSSPTNKTPSQPTSGASPTVATNNNNVRSQNSGSLTSVDVAVDNFVKTSTGIMSDVVFGALGTLSSSTTATLAAVVSLGSAITGAPSSPTQLVTGHLQSTLESPDVVVGASSQRSNHYDLGEGEMSLPSLESSFDPKYKRGNFAWASVEPLQSTWEHDPAALHATGASLRPTTSNSLFLLNRAGSGGGAPVTSSSSSFLLQPQSSMSMHSDTSSTVGGAQYEQWQRGPWEYAERWPSESLTEDMEIVVDTLVDAAAAAAQGKFVWMRDDPLSVAPVVAHCLVRRRRWTRLVEDRRVLQQFRQVKSQHVEEMESVLKRLELPGPVWDPR